MKTWRNISQLLSILSLLITVIGCGDASKSGPFGPPHNSPLLSPFAGQWIFEDEKTLAAPKATGTSAEHIEMLRKIWAENPQYPYKPPDLTFTGNEATGGAGILCAEYRFLTVHQHADKICQSMVSRRPIRSW